LSGEREGLSGVTRGCEDLSGITGKRAGGHPNNLERNASFLHALTTARAGSLLQASIPSLKPSTFSTSALGICKVYDPHLDM
jgi:hypothetical protein